MAPRKTAERYGDLTGISSQTESSLMKLPAELRNRIFNLACHDFTMRYESRRKRPTVPGVGRRMYTPKPDPPGIVVACKQTYLETIQVLYAGARFVFEKPYLVKSWAPRLPFNYKLLARKIEIVQTIKWDDRQAYGFGYA